MQFVYPTFLYALTAVLIPILIHLFNLRRPKKVFFSNVELLKEVEQQTTKKLKVKHWLILASRILFITFLVLLFAQPFIPSGFENKISNKPFFSIYIDNSLSMSLPYSEDENLYDKAKNEITKLIDVLPRNAKIQLLTNDFNNKSLIFHNKEQAKDLLTEFDFSKLHRTNEEIYNKIVSNIKNANSDDKNLIWVSDFQKKNKEFKIDLDSSIQHYLVPLNGIESSTIFIDSIEISSPFINSNEIYSLKVWIKNSGNKDLDNILIQLFENENQISMQNIGIAKNSTLVQNISFSCKKEGLNKMKLSISNDQVNYDNNFLFTLNVNEKIKIFEIHSKDQPSFEKIYQSESSFVYTSESISNLDYSKLMTQNLIILNEPKQITNSLISILNEFLESGGNLAIIPNHDNLSIFSDFGVQFSENIDTNKYEMEMIKPENMFFAGVFNEYSSNVELPLFTPKVDFKSLGKSILQLENGNSLLHNFTYHKGQIFAFASSFDDKESTIFNHSFIVPLSFKLAMNSSKSNQNIFYRIGQEIIVSNLTSMDSETIIKLKSSAVEVIPSQRIQNGNLILKVYNDNFEADFYDLIKQDSIINVLAFNIDKSESILNYYTSSELKKNSSKLTVLNQNDEINFIDTFQEQNFGLALWKYCLMLSLLFLAIEIILIRLL